MLLLISWTGYVRANPIEPKEIKFPQHYSLTLTENNTYKISGRYNTNSERLVAFEKEGADDLAEIFLYYQALFNKAPKLQLQLDLEKTKSEKLQLKVKSLERSAEDLTLALGLMRDSRNLYKEALELQESNNKDLEKKKKAVFVMSIIGTGIGALAVGLVIGFVAAK